MKLTKRHERAVFHVSVGLPISDRMGGQLAEAGLIWVAQGEIGLTHAGCDMATGRTRVKRGRIVRVKR